MLRGSNRCFDGLRHSSAWAPFVAAVLPPVRFFGGGGGGGGGVSDDQIARDRRELREERRELREQQKEWQRSLQPPAPIPAEKPPPPTRRTTAETIQAEEDARRQAARRKGINQTTFAGQTKGFGLGPKTQPSLG